MENTDKKHGVIAERVLEKEEQKEIGKAKDKETKSVIRSKLADIADEVYDAMIDRFVEPFNGQKQDDEIKAEKSANSKAKIADAIDGAFDSLVNRMAEKMEQKEESFSKDLETAKDTVVAFVEGKDTGIGEVAHMVEQEIVEDYKKLETGVVDSYKKVEEGFVGGFNKVADGFVEKFLVKDGESVEEARERLAKKQEERMEKAKAYGDPAKSLEKSRSYGDPQKSLEKSKSYGYKGTKK